MAWRVVEVDDRLWNVTLAAERRAPHDHWQLVLAFRRAEGGASSVWAEYPLSASSRSALLIEAERIPNDRLAAVLSDLLA
ncbi:MAG TPA: hypothetical protein VFX50_04775 [Gemmatimonadales bacterium]|nr:hypothetical protein [Gemmatimonadales bacterium]